ncbi:hypothetical protein DCD95_11300 [Acinetobacter baumannii]|nr:hypothetical protein DCD95_11300 [Acinetobacter baumannii]
MKMSKQERVLKLIEQLGRDRVLDICRGMVRNKVFQCEVNDNVVDYRTKTPKNPDNVFTYIELIDGLSEHSKENFELDKKSDEYREIFEPIAKSTALFKKQGSELSFEFDNLKYTNEVTQAMFEVFLKTHNLNK